VTNVENVRDIDVAALNTALGVRGAMISNGYGELKDECFRIAHMGDLTVSDIEWLLGQISDILGLI
jgi:aspartate aminotransferase-like enzyme